MGQASDAVAREGEAELHLEVKAGMLEVNEDMSYIPMAAYGHSKLRISSSPWV